MTTLVPEMGYYEVSRWLRLLVTRHGPPLVWLRVFLVVVVHPSIGLVSASFWQ